MNEAKLSVGECLKKGWEIFMSRPWFFVGATIVIAIVQLISGGAQQAFPGVIGFIISLVISTLLYAGIMKLFLNAHDNASSASLKDLWNPQPFLNYLILSILLALIIGIGFVLLIIPGIFALLVFFLSGYLLIDKGMKPIAALKESARLTKGNRFSLLLLVIAMALITIVAMIPFFLGLFVAVPVVALAGVHAYKTLSKVA